jgi:SNW domain-containing protein 1
MDSGFGAEDDYNVYSKPMVDRGKANVYRPKVDPESSFDADKDFQALQGGATKYIYIYIYIYICIYFW